MIGVADIGNTRIKWGVFEKGGQLISSGVIECDESLMFEQLHDRYKVTQWLWSSVRVNDHLPKVSFGYTLLSVDMPLPVTIGYATPYTLGKDRLAAVCGAVAIFPKEAILIMDAGTCITYDFVDAKGYYYGGNILPGILMRLKAMHAFTGQLPLLEWNAPHTYRGDDTASSMLTGVASSILAEASYFYQKYSEEFGPLRLVICGGDMSYFAENLKMNIFAAPNLVLTGLYSIINYQNEQHA